MTTNDPMLTVEERIAYASARDMLATYGSLPWTVAAFHEGGIQSISLETPPDPISARLHVQEFARALVREGWTKIGWLMMFGPESLLPRGRLVFHASRRAESRSYAWPYAIKDDAPPGQPQYVFSPVEVLYTKPYVASQFASFWQEIDAAGRPATAE